MNIINVACITDNHYEIPQKYRIDITDSPDVNNYLMTKLTTFDHTHNVKGDFIWIAPVDFDTIRWEVEELFECALIITSVRLSDMWKTVFEGI